MVVKRVRFSASSARSCAFSSACDSAAVFALSAAAARALAEERVPQSVGQLGCHFRFPVRFHTWVPLLELLAQRAVQRACPGLQHEVSTGF